eukprot:359184-Chlamydomonas_euryale.AAC.2
MPRHHLATATFPDPQTALRLQPPSASPVRHTRPRVWNASGVTTGQEWIRNRTPARHPGNFYPAPHKLSNGAEICATNYRPRGQRERAQF